MHLVKYLQIQQFQSESGNLVGPQKVSTVVIINALITVYNILQMLVAYRVNHWYCWVGCHLVTASVIITVEKSFSLMVPAPLYVR